MRLSRSPAKRPPGRVTKSIAAFLTTAMLLLLFSLGCAEDKDELDCDKLIPGILLALESDHLTQDLKEEVAMEYFYCKAGILTTDYL